MSEQRLRVSDEKAQISDGNDVVTFGYATPGDIVISRRESVIDPGIPGILIVNGNDNIGELGTWMTSLKVKGPGIDVSGANFSTLNETESRVAAITVLSPHDKEITALLDYSQIIVDALSEVLDTSEDTTRRTRLDERVFLTRLLQPIGRSALLAQHRAGELAIFTENHYSPIPVDMINSLGEWILEGKGLLVKKSIWDF